MACDVASNEDLLQFLNQLTSGKHHPFVKNYGYVLARALHDKGDQKEWRGRFDELKTDFDRVCFILQALEDYFKDKGIKAFDEYDTNMENLLSNGKSDSITASCLLSCNTFAGSNSEKKALNAINRAYFCAISEKSKTTALMERMRFNYDRHYYLEAIKDGIAVLGHDISVERLLNTYEWIAKCYKALNMPEKCKFYKDLVAKARMTNDVSKIAQSLCQIKREIADIENGNASEINYTPKWKCIHPEPPENLSGVETLEEKQNGDITKHKTDQKIIMKENLLRAKNTGTDRGWALETTRKVSPGEVLLTDKPYASVLNYPYTGYCYCCYKRCINIRPCEGCAMVGFCSEKCAEDARSPNPSSTGGSGRHVYDCGGLLSCLRLDDLFMDIETEEHLFGQGLTHLAYTCIANTPANMLLDFVCCTGQYESLTERHQGFEEADCTRRKPSFPCNSTDYSAVAWLFANPKELRKDVSWEYAVIAVFLTYCLWKSGYSMKWFNEAGESFYTTPSRQNRPDSLPASWIATCMLYQLKVVRFNASSYMEYLDTSQKLRFNRNWLAYCIYPNISLINHDCDPNACLVYTANGGTFLYALRMIEEGEEVTLSYDYYYFRVQEAYVRQRYVNERYMFQCFCDACMNDWQVHKMKEFIRCSECQKSFPVDKKKCPKHGSTGSYERYQYLIHQILPDALKSINSEVFGKNDAQLGVSLLKMVQETVAFKSSTSAYGISTAMRVIDRGFGVRTIDDLQTVKCLRPTLFQQLAWLSIPEKKRNELKIRHLLN